MCEIIQKELKTIGIVFIDTGTHLFEVGLEFQCFKSVELISHSQLTHANCPQILHILAYLLHRMIMLSSSNNFLSPILQILCKLLGRKEAAKIMKDN